MITFASFPETVTFYDRMGVEAARKNARIGGAWRVWVLAKRLDFVGMGRVRREDLYAYAKALGIHPRTWQRWLNEARNNDFVRDVQKSDGEWWLILPSAANVAKEMGIAHVGTRKVVMEAAALIGNGWRARVFSALEHDRQMSREQIQKQYNVSVSTQRYRDRQAGTIRERNYAKSNWNAKFLPAVKEFTNHKDVFVTKDGFVAWRLPDMRHSPHAKALGRGRSKKANKTLSHHGLLQHCKQALSGKASQGKGFIRLFNDTPEQLEAAKRNAAKQLNRPNELYLRASTTKSGATLWKVEVVEAAEQ